LKELPKVLINRPNIIFYVFVGLFVGLFLYIEQANEKFWTNDLYVYYGAVHDFFRGNDPYLHAYGLTTGYFKYPPFALYLFAPLYWLSFENGQVLHLILSTLSLAVSIPLLQHVCERIRPKPPKYLLYIAFFSIAVPIARELHMGNINLILLGLFSGGVYFFDRKNVLVVLCWSLMIILKPIMIIALVPLFFWGHWRLILGCALMGAFFVVFPVIHLGFKATIDYWIHWINAVSEHGTYISSLNSLRYIAHYYLGTNSEWLPSLVVLTVLTTILIYTRFTHKTNMSLREWCIVFTALIPNFFVTDTEHFLLSVPLIMLLTTEMYRTYPHKFRWIYWTTFSAAIFLFSLNSRDLLGRQLDDFLSYRGAVGIGNLLFITLFLVIKFNWWQNTSIQLSSKK